MDQYTDNYGQIPSPFDKGYINGKLTARNVAAMLCSCWPCHLLLGDVCKLLKYSLLWGGGGRVIMM